MTQFSLRTKITLILVLFAGILCIDLAYLPSVNNKLFPTDDNALAEAPQILDRFDRRMLKTVFTIGSQIDYYPIRDLSYAVDYQLFSKQWDKWKLHNLFLLNEIILALFGLLV